MATLTDREYDAELHKLHDQLLLMGAKVEEMIANSMRALTERDSELARRMIEFDHQINRLEVEIDELCLRILAKRQPVASDLRLITTALKLVTDLERIGDSCVNICERVVELNMEPTLKPYVDLPRMAETVQAMVRDALDAFVQADPERAREVVERDRVVDAYYGQVFRELLTYMMEDPRNIYRAVRAQSIAKYLERIGDHATNLAEMVIFMVVGKDVRHLGSMAEPTGRRMPRGMLFVGTHNAARSQMAEGWARKLFPAGRAASCSAGAEPSARDQSATPCASCRKSASTSRTQRPKPVGDVPLGDIDTVITLCAEEGCALPPGGLAQHHWGSRIRRAVQGTDEEIMASFAARATRSKVGWRTCSRSRNDASGHGAHGNPSAAAAGSALSRMSAGLDANKNVSLACSGGRFASPPSPNTSRPIHTGQPGQAFGSFPRVGNRLSRCDAPAMLRLIPLGHGRDFFKTVRSLATFWKPRRETRQFSVTTLPASASCGEHPPVRTTGTRCTTQSG